ncbi:MAG: isoprenyl transferase [Deltaproteobacteria bacterium]|nr:isoprenyl transferase [Deltaproteobacteria bacterium]
MTKSIQIPQHIAIIMDGNGRWAEKRFLPRIAGHRQGAKNVRMVVQACRRLGVDYLTLFAFSTENWKRPRKEVDALLKLLIGFLADEMPEMLTNGIRFNVIGDLDMFPARVRSALIEGMERTAHLKDMVLTLALSYGGRDEIVRAVRHLVEKVQEGALPLEEIDESVLADFLDTRNMPDPDLLIRTSGEQRISNFLLWQLAYSEIFFTEVTWPEFDEQQFQRALEEYGRRQRRFGLTQAQILAGNDGGGR